MGFASKYFPHAPEHENISQSMILLFFQKPLSWLVIEPLSNNVVLQYMRSLKFFFQYMYAYKK